MMAPNNETIVFNGKRQMMKKDFEKDCKNFKYIPHILKQTSRTIAIGDIHGDLDVAVKMLEIAKCIKKVNIKPDTIKSTYVTLINKNGNKEYYIWIGNDTQVVQVGDQVDRCRPIGDNTCIYPDGTFDDEASDIKILKFYTDINELAINHGGRVISLLGNHELMNVLGNMNYVSYKGIVDFSNTVDLASGLINRKLAFTNKLDVDKNPLKNINSAYIDGYDLNKYLACTRMSGVIIGSLLFVHGGLIKKMAELYKLDDMNKIVRKWLLGKLAENTDDKINQILSSSDSIFWNRTLSYLPADGIGNSEDIAKKCDENLKDIFEIYNVNGIIIGHTPQRLNASVNRINSACNERVWRVDIGASNAFHSLRDKQTIEVLEITYNGDVPLYKILS